MSNRGYSFESEIEGYFLDLEGKKRQDAIFDATGRICRTFRVPTSGMMASMPGDVITGNHNFPQQFMIECKARYHMTKKSGQVFRLDTDWVDKNEQESYKAGYLPIFVLSFKRMKKYRIWAVLDEKVYTTLFHYTFTNKPAPFTRKKKTITLVKKVLDANPATFNLERWYLLPWQDVWKVITNLYKKVAHEEEN